ncbi:DUF1501 domain-containing protein [Telmatocola sphagniphila]|nr:DUF1501 domain-containing protein [Telmatocola sphagniphila]
MLPPALLQASSNKAKAKSVILLYQWGGPSQFETFDMKPDAPAEIRGTFKPISTKVPGISVCEMLPRMTNIIDQCVLVKSVQHTMKNHNSAGYYSLTGFAPPTDDQRLRDSPELAPAFGCVVDKFSQARPGVPTFVSYPYSISDGSITPGQHASFLGKVHNPFFFTEDPAGKEFKLPELTLPGNISSQRLEDRKEMLKMLDQQSRVLEQHALAKGMDESFQRAVSLLTSKELKEAFDLSKEKKKVRAQYGETTYGQGCLLARRLVQAGVKFVTVYISPYISGEWGWDTHGFQNQPMDPILKKRLLPITNQTLPTLLEDLKERGMLEETLVLWMGEFGRTPKINNIAGRDHWPECYTVLMAGGGLKKGYVHGSSDKNGAFPASGACRIEDISATMYELLGIDPNSEMIDKLNRPLPISRGKPIREIIA